MKNRDRNALENDIEDLLDRYIVAKIRGELDAKAETVQELTESVDCISDKMDGVARMGALERSLQAQTAQIIGASKSALDGQGIGDKYEKLTQSFERAETLAKECQTDFDAKIKEIHENNIQRHDQADEQIAQCISEIKDLQEQLSSEKEEFTENFLQYKAEADWRYAFLKNMIMLIVSCGAVALAGVIVLIVLALVR